MYFTGNWEITEQLLHDENIPDRHTEASIIPFMDGVGMTSTLTPTITSPTAVTFLQDLQFPYFQLYPGLPLILIFPILWNLFLMSNDLSFSI